MAVVIDAAEPPLTGDAWRSSYPDSFATWLGPLTPLAQLVPGRRPYLRPVNTTAHETLDRCVLTRWQQGVPEYRPRNPDLRPWLKDRDCPDFS